MAGEWLKGIKPSSPQGGTGTILSPDHQRSPAAGSLRKAHPQDSGTPTLPKTNVVLGQEKTPPTQQPDHQHRVKGNSSLLPREGSNMKESLFEA